MTKHNLAEHLNWLLCLEAPTTTTTLGASSAVQQIETEAQQAIEEPDTSNISLESSITEEENAVGSKPDFEFVVPPLPDKLLKRTEEMARLHSSTKSSNKAQLLSHRRPDVLPSPTPGDRPQSGPTWEEHGGAQQRQSDYTESNHGTNRLTNGADVSSFRVPMSRNGSATGSSVDGLQEWGQNVSSSSSVEVFGEPQPLWLEDSATRTEPLGIRGKKRKSGELDGDEEDFYTPGRTPPRASQSSFISIEAYEESPKSRIASVTKKQRTSPVPDSNPFANQAEDFELIPKDFVPSSSYRPQGMFSQTPKRSRNKTSTSPEKNHKRKRKVIADSDEDEDQRAEEQEDGILLDSEVPKSQKSTLVAEAMIYPTLPGWTPEEAKDDTKQHHSTQSPNPNSKVKRTIPTEPVHSASPFQKDSPTKAPEKKCSQQGMGSQSSSPLTISQDAIVQGFMKCSSSRFHEVVERLRLRRKALADAAYQIVMQGFRTLDFDFNQSVNESASIRTHIMQMNKLISLQEEYQMISDEKAKVKTRVMDALDADIPDADNDFSANDFSAMQSLARRLNETKKTICAMLAEVSAFFTLFGDLPDVETSAALGKAVHPAHQPAVMVQSTQSRGDLVQSESNSKGSFSNNFPNPLVEQTPCAFREVVPTYRACQSSIANIEEAPPRPVIQNNRMVPASPVTDWGASRMAAQGGEAPTTQGLINYPDDGSRDRSHEASRGRHPDTRRMGSPLCQPDEEDYCGDFGDDAILEAAEYVEHPQASTPHRQSTEKRPVFAETNGNILRAPSQKASPVSRTQPPAAQMNFPWSHDVKIALKERFHLYGFRPNQLEAINATLGGKDAFVLMPTGGGKSLCYQLPSIVSSGKTKGVTIVISPLLSLMQDQVDHLQKLRIQALLINGEVSAEHRSLVFKALRSPCPEQLVQLLYITPEMINKSQVLISVLQDLYKRNKLARIVIDEAHCVSQWGHDFRPDYKAIGEVRRQFHGVPVMALTATATENVKVDVIHNLGIRNCKVFTQSFNRPNLTYEVHPKGKVGPVLSQMAAIIKNQYPNQSGIIYCLSRKNCEDVARKLREEHKIKAHHYHAGMEASKKMAIQKEWQAGVHNVMVATIAFGMGIDKPDVRFVFHFTIPKSLEGYYQETGRAGRDGKRSGCYLFYGYQDTTSLRRMIDEGEGSDEQKDRQRTMLKNVIQFCENKSDCRRVQVLNYFNESFSSKDCHNSCDNCNSNVAVTNKDFTRYAVAAIQLVKSIERSNVTMLYCIDLFRGWKTKKITDAGHDELRYYNFGGELERSDVERIFYRLLTENALWEKNVIARNGFAHQYVRVGDAAEEFINYGRKLVIQVRDSQSEETRQPKQSKQPKTKKKGTAIAGIQVEQPQSTNVPSPRIPKARRRLPVQSPDDGEENDSDDERDLPRHANGYARDGHVVSDGEVEYESSDHAFVPIRAAGAPRRKNKADIGPPITADEMLKGVDDIHRGVIENFVILANREAQKICLEKNLRKGPFSETLFREMALRFPTSLNELLKLPGIKAEQVECYGRRFINIIQSVKQSYEAMLHQCPVDPNHQNAYVISSDDEYGGDDFMCDEDEDENAVEQSSYFQQSEAVREFNNQLSQVRTMAPAPAKPQEPPDRSKSNRGGFQQGKGRGKGGSVGGSFYKKRSASGAGGKSGTASNHSAANKRGGAGPKAQGVLIGMMPT